MTPEQLTQFREMQQKIERILRCEDVNFIKAIERNTDLTSSEEVRSIIGQASINDLLDVDISSVTDGQVLKYTTVGTDRWVNGTDNT